MAQIMPETSISVPLIAMYLLFTMSMVALSVILSVIVSNIHYRSTSTHVLPGWMKRFFIIKGFWNFRRSEIYFWSTFTTPSFLKWTKNRQLNSISFSVAPLIGVKRPNACNLHLPTDHTRRQAQGESEAMYSDSGAENDPLLSKGNHSHSDIRPNH